MTLCLKTKKEQAEKIKRKLISLNLFDSSKAIDHDLNYVYLPLKTRPSENLGTVVEMKLREQEKRAKSLEEILQGKLTRDETNYLKTSYDLLGEIALITPPIGMSAFLIAGIAGVAPEKVFKGVAPFFATSNVLLWLLVFWWRGVVYALAVLFQAPIYAWFIVVLLRDATPYALLILAWILAAMLVTWPKFPKVMIPGFLNGLRDAISRRRNERDLT